MGHLLRAQGHRGQGVNVAPHPGLPCRTTSSRSSPTTSCHVSAGCGPSTSTTTSSPLRVSFGGQWEEAPPQPGPRCPLPPQLGLWAALRQFPELPFAEQDGNSENRGRGLWLLRTQRGWGLEEPLPASRLEGNTGCPHPHHRLEGSLTAHLTHRPARRGLRVAHTAAAHLCGPQQGEHPATPPPRPREGPARAQPAGVPQR